MKHVLRILAIPIFLALFASCESSVTEAPQDTSTEIEALLSADWGEEDSLVLITSVPDYLARFEWDYTGQLSDGRCVQRQLKLQLTTVKISVFQEVLRKRI